ncbi:MAG: hypothetical protein WDN45_13455 [Caulobacteraceae bacterium]
MEGDVALHARSVLAEKTPRRLVYGRGGPPDIQLLCGSRIEVLLERIEPDDAALARLLQLEAARRPALWLSDGEVRACLAEDEIERPAPRRPARRLGQGLRAAGGERPGGERHLPPPRAAFPPGGGGRRSDHPGGGQAGRRGGFRDRPGAAQGPGLAAAGRQCPLFPRRAGRGLQDARPRSLDRRGHRHPRHRHRP